MKPLDLVICIVVMATVTYLIRMIPFALFKRKITSPFLRDLLSYIPYAVLAAMTVPAIFYSTGNAITAIVGTAVAVILSYVKCPLIVVAISAAAAALVTGFIV